MGLFDTLVQEALRERPDLAPLRAVVEKELLHHDILRELGTSGLLQDLVFIGGTCLRMCYGSPRLSEDLDFTTALGPDKLLETLSRLPRTLEERMYTKYRLPVTVSEPIREEGLVRTWKLRITTRPERPDLPAQRIHIDVQVLPARDPQPILPRNPYRVEMGTSTLILSASSQREILADKCFALALRRGRVKWRDIWDIAWLIQRDIPLSPDLITQKASDRGVSVREIADLIRRRIEDIQDNHADFLGEMQRFLPPGDLLTAAGDERYWMYLMQLIPSLVSVP